MVAKALLVIDYIKGIALGGGSCANYLKEYPYVIENTNALIDCARNHGIPIYHIRLAFDSEYHGLPKYAPSANAIKGNQRFQLNSEATEFISDIQIKSEDHIINKTYGDIFHGNSLMQLLKNNHTKEIILTGVSTDNAILNSSNTAILNDLYVTVVQDACGAPTMTAHENALGIMKGRTASEIADTEVVMQALSKP